jgi:hypothetical protein
MMIHCAHHRYDYPEGGACIYCARTAMGYNPAQFDPIPATWNTAYPDRRPWSEIGGEAQEEWRRVFAIYDSLKP